MRLFNEHILRRPQLLDGMWDMAFDSEIKGESEKWYQDFPNNAIKVLVPSCINNRLGFMDYQSIVWYKKDFIAGGALSIKFYGVTEYAKVYVDGKFLGEHYGGFTAFEFDLNLEYGQHILTVMVDSRSTEDTIPLWAVDWHHYCGIIRSVEVTQFKSTAIKSVTVSYKLSDDLKTAKVTINAHIKNMYANSLSENVKISIDGMQIFNETVNFSDDIKICAETKINNIKLWDIHKPNLYVVCVQTENDDLIDKFGFRKIEVSDNKIMLNNRHIKLMGVNRHEEHPDWGFAMPPQMNIKDMDILKNLGVNAVRGSHYPNTQFFVDLCDSEGILFWSEIPMWGFEKESVERNKVIERGLNMHSEMIEQYQNHPSIVIWGLHNEIATDTMPGRNITKLFADHIKSLDNSRLITYATNRILKDICLDLVDFISVNQYVGWYEGDIADWEDFMTQMKSYLKSQGVDSKPVVMSEFGVGAIFGTKTFEGLRWSENYQVEFYKHTLNLFLNDNDISGTYLWQFSDIRSNAKWSLLRARSFNNKGLVNEYRQPKLAYYAVKEIFENERNKRCNM